MTLKDYDILDSIGTGATSEVFKALRQCDQETVALKMFLPVFCNDKELKLRLIEEFNVMEKLDHPNIVKLINSISTQDKFGLELEFVEGNDLREWTKNHFTTLVEAKIWILIQVARGLGAAHERGIIHRDLKPENILISNNGEVKLTDFGLAKHTGRLTMTRVGLLVGSLGYMAPEIVNGAKATMQSDIFSFGAIAYELLSSTAPFSADTPQAMIKKVMDGQIKELSEYIPSLPAEITNLIMSCLKQKATDRPESIWMVEAQLMQYLMRENFMDEAKQLLIKDSSRGTTIKNALKKKHTLLSARSEKLLKDELINRNSLISHINELQSLFPDDTKLEALISKLNTPTKKQKKLSPIIILVFILSLFTFFIVSELYFNNSNKITHINTLKNETPKQPESPIKNKNTSNMNANAAPKKITSKVKPKVAKGSVRFEVDPGVDVIVDNKIVPKASHENYRLKPGKYKMKLIKNGFLPIEGEILVRAGKSTVIRARGN